MKSQERHKLKENEFARTVGTRAGVVDAAAGHHVGVAVVVVLLAVVGGYAWWRSPRDARQPSCWPPRSRSTKRQ